MEFPQSVLRAVEKASEKHPSDISGAVDEAERAIRRLPEFNDLVATLVRSAVQDLVYDARHASNVAMKREVGGYGGPAKTTSGDSEAVQRAAESVYLYRIAGTVLGSILGSELAGIADTEASIAEGHVFNSELCRRLEPMVPKTKQVREAVSEKRLRALFGEVQEHNRSAA